MKHIKDFFIKTLTSRKFWAAVTAAVPFAAIGDWQSFAYVWMGYAGIQGAVDASERVGSTRETLKIGSVELTPDQLAAVATSVVNAAASTVDSKAEAVAEAE